MLHQRQGCPGALLQLAGFSELCTRRLIWDTLGKFSGTVLVSFALTNASS
jgi:hypothetical protein